MKNDKMKKIILSGIKRGTRGKKEEICFTMHFLQSKSFLVTSIFFYFGISNCFVIAKRRIAEKILQWNQINHPITNLEDEVDLGSLFLCFFRVLDTWLTPRTCPGHVNEQKIKKNGWPSNSVPEIWGHVPVPRTCPGHFQLRFGGANFWCLLSHCFFTHADNVSFLKNILLRKNVERKIPFSQPKFEMALFELVLLIVDCNFATRKVLVKELI